MAIMNFPQLQIKIVSTITLLAVSFTGSLSPLKAQSTKPDNKISSPSSVRVRLLPPSLSKQKPLDFSGDGRPSPGRREGGGSRSPCPPMKPPLTALMPVNNRGKTVAEHPTFWFYVPYALEKASSGEFVLQDKAHNDVFRTQFALPAETPGFVSFELPPTAAPLAINKWYRWYFKLYCEPQKLSTPVFVQGWVQRVELNAELERQLRAAAPRQYIAYLNNDIWYDAIARLLDLRLAQPNNLKFEQDWTNLLSVKSVNLEHLNQRSIAGSAAIDQRLGAD